MKKGLTLEKRGCAMLLLGFEMGPGSLLGMPNANALYGNFFSITPIRQGRVNFRLAQYFSLAYLAELEQETKRLRETTGGKQYFVQGQGADFSPNTCGAFTYGTWGDSSKFYPIPVGLCAIPYYWENMPQPQTLITPMVSYTSFRASETPLSFGILGPLPQIQLLQSILSLLKAKPGSDFTLPGKAGFPNVGGSLNATSANRSTGKSASQGFALNPGEVLDSSIGDSMPALNPKEFLTFDVGFSNLLCDIRKLTKTDAGAQGIMNLLTALKPLQRSTQIVPTDCILVDKANQVAQLLGDSLDYEGIIIKETPSAPQFKGSAPADFDLSGVAYMKLNFSRSIALCEDRKLVSEGSTSYEYSQIPLPSIVASQSVLAVKSLLPKSPLEGVLTPKFLAGPSIKGTVEPAEPALKFE
ncbi:MAG: hypothetical protein Q7T57_07445 [Dehalococcoidales bacterium]|nr:hypothetical protein [Dehalococcoidales bacterium]